MTVPPATVVAALARAVAEQPGRPLLTMYDDATGERVELSGATFDNWVTKLANLFTGDWELEPGDVLGVALPAHWTSVVTVVGAWTAGLAVDLRPGVPAAMTLTDWAEFAEQVPGQPDVLLMPVTIAPGDDALIDAAGTTSHAALVARGLATAETVGLPHGGRLATDRNPLAPGGIEVALFAPLAVGASVVLVFNATDDRRTRLAEQERATVQAWAGSDARSPASSSDEPSTARAHRRVGG